MSVYGAEGGNNHFVFLDFLRGVAALSVLLLHWFSGHGKVFFGSSVLAVDFFFMLSGFVISRSYGMRLADGYGTFKFLLFRAIRLYPLLAFGVLLGAIRVTLASIESGGPSLSAFPFWEFASTMFLIPQAVQESGVVDFYPLNNPLWSLFFEWWAYVAFGLLLYKLNRACLVFVIVLSCLLFSSWAIHKFGGVSDWWLLNSGQPYGLLFGLGRIGVSFSLGILIERNLSRIQSGVPASALMVAFPAFLVLMSAPNQMVPAWLVVSSVMLLFPLVIVAGTKVRCEGGLRKFYNFFGDVSYPLYVIHVPVIWTLNGVLKSTKMVEDNHLVWFGLIILPVTILISKLSYDVYDKPVRKWLRSKATKALERSTKLEIGGVS